MVAVVGTAAFFALTHFELLQFPALFAFGLILGPWSPSAPVAWACRSAAHLGFNLVAAATLVWNIPRRCGRSW